MNLSLAERPVCLPVATTSGPSLASLPSPLTRAASKSGAVPKFQCCTASLENPCFSSVTEDFAFTRVLPLIKNQLSDPVYHMIVQNEHRDLLAPARSEEHTSELQSLMHISYAVFCLKKKKYKLIIY